jgi:hypothetical protein
MTKYKIVEYEADRFRIYRKNKFFWSGTGITYDSLERATEMVMFYKECDDKEHARLNRVGFKKCSWYF